MTSPTNLSDEGLRHLASDIVTGNRGHMALLVLDEQEKIQSIATALQQVRDAAKNEEREECARTADIYGGFAPSAIRGKGRS